jgi:hypothetical protein
MGIEMYSIGRYGLGGYSYSKYYSTHTCEKGSHGSFSTLVFGLVLPDLKFRFGFVRDAVMYRMVSVFLAWARRWRFE